MRHYDIVASVFEEDRPSLMNPGATGGPLHPNDATRLANVTDRND